MRVGGSSGKGKRIHLEPGDWIPPGKPRRYKASNPMVKLTWRTPRGDLIQVFEDLVDANGYVREWTEDAVAIAKSQRKKRHATTTSPAR